MTGGRGFMASEEVQLDLEDVKEKFDTVMGGINMINEKLDRHIEENRKDHERFEIQILELGHDLNEHRESTELHGIRREKKA
jgi:hypothetical protein